MPDYFLIATTFMLNIRVLPASGGLKSTVAVFEVTVVTTPESPDCVETCRPTVTFVLLNSESGACTIKLWFTGPYASLGGSVTVLFCPTCMPMTALLNPGITSPAPTVKLNGALPTLVLNTVPLVTLPV